MTTSAAASSDLPEDVGTVSETSLSRDPSALTRDTPVVRDVAVAMADADTAHRRLRAVFAASVGLSPVEFNALMHIAQVDDLTPKALAVHLDITTGAVTAMTDRLVGAGLVERRPNPDDRRSLLLGLTEMGDRARQTVYGQYYDAIARALEGAPEVPVDGLVALLESTASALTETSDAIEGTTALRH